jgi:hypothetical protein
MTMRLRMGAAALLCLAAATPGAAEQPLSAPGPEGALAGTLVEPGEDRPLVLILPGSGPTDRDGNNPGGVTAAPYRLLAEALAEHGVGTLRIDKRGIAGSRNAAYDPNAVTIADYVEDTRRWIAAARAETDVPCVWLLGHSEGGVIALAAADAGVPDICGVLLVAVPGRGFADVLREQLRANPANAPILAEAEGALAVLEAGNRVDATRLHPALQGMFSPSVQGFIIDLMAHDPAALAAKAEVPMLIVQGGRDMQVAQADGDALAAANPDATYVTIADMNHVLKTVETDERQANLMAYVDPSRPVSPRLVAAILEFLAQQGAIRP